MFPVAVRLFHFPPTYDMSDVYSFAKEFGRVERVTKLSESRDRVEDGFDWNGEFRVQYVERFTILLLLHNRSQLTIRGHAIGAEPLFV